MGGGDTYFPYSMMRNSLSPVARDAELRTRFPIVPFSHCPVFPIPALVAQDIAPVPTIASTASHPSPRTSAVEAAFPRRYVERRRTCVALHCASSFPPTWSCRLLPSDLELPTPSLTVSVAELDLSALERPRADSIHHEIDRCSINHPDTRRLVRAACLSPLHRPAPRSDLFSS